MLSHGVAGVAFSYSPAIAFKRSIYISASFFRECDDLANTVKFAVSSLKSNWKEITTMEEFATLTASATLRKTLQNDRLGLLFFSVFQRKVSLDKFFLFYDFVAAQYKETDVGNWFVLM